MKTTKLWCTLSLKTQIYCCTSIVNMQLNRHIRISNINPTFTTKKNQAHLWSKQRKKYPKSVQLSSFAPSVSKVSNNIGCTNHHNPSKVELAGV